MLSLFAIIVKTLTLSIEFFFLIPYMFIQIIKLKATKVYIFPSQKYRSCTLFDKPKHSHQSFLNPWHLENVFVPHGFFYFSSFFNLWTQRLNMDSFTHTCKLVHGFKKMGLDLKLTRGIRGPYVKNKKIELKKNKLQP